MFERNHHRYIELNNIELPKLIPVFAKYVSVYIFLLLYVLRICAVCGRVLAIEHFPPNAQRPE